MKLFDQIKKKKKIEQQIIKEGVFEFIFNLSKVFINFEGMYQGQEQEKWYKMIKFFRIKKEKDKYQQKELSWQENIRQIKKKLDGMMIWSRKDFGIDVEKTFVLFPGQSIYNEGIRIQKIPQQIKQTFELIMMRMKGIAENAIVYEYRYSNILYDPAASLKKVGYDSIRRRYQSVSVFVSFKFGLEVWIYGEKEENNRLGEKCYLQIVERKRKKDDQFACIWKEIYENLKNNLIEVKDQDINFNEMAPNRSSVGWLEHCVS